MRPQTSVDWIAFALVILGAFAWGFFVFDVNILDLLLEAIWDPLDNIVFALIALAGLYLLARAFMRKPV
ncbi:DUF378 domain-containing protein [Pelagibacterium luteolum]|uniref:DUF378 domain-containing protein n=1 Tax=Pelagibacterium luteolum TaxID=440168 RepID=A0A1G7ZUW9_9HYPH|nr:DUF378 domain-containing protein [Pelagibacterium luteolum]SDH12396.1 hypothetical protein SAMN04487974_1233 [Pelagibacterium luteolum]